MTDYLVTFRPLGDYSFGSDRRFSFVGKNNYSEDEYAPYFIRTNRVPEQSTVFGMIRYLILVSNGIQLNQDFQYDENTRDKIKALIGEKSFSLNGGVQSFGKLEKISPIFLRKNSKEVVIPNPFNNKQGREGIDQFEPIILEEEITLPTSFGEIALPKSKEYNPKEGYGDGYYNINTGCLEGIEDIFMTKVATGVRRVTQKDLQNLKINIRDLCKLFVNEDMKQEVSNLDRNSNLSLTEFINDFMNWLEKYNKGEKNHFQEELEKLSKNFDADRLFKREVHQLHKDYEFAVYVKVKDNFILKDGIVPMGQKGTLFKVSVQKSENNLESEITKHFQKHTPKGQTWQYCLSDVCLLNDVTGFAILEEKLVRQLHTDLKENRLKGLSLQGHHLLYKAGSVFYGDDKIPLKSGIEAAGYNVICKIEGSKE
ncbi:CRISPR-associated protein (Cas_Cmr3) [Streptococcus oralis subsp. dentisani]|jgi:hypothetical protein|uniref:CRISPR-associated protein (Cas_Cmr3) n=2 Tax=Streptococcus oralis TaxID=1303 RepID=A0A1X1IUM8_STROR|nr:hypothetical protein [Streptococcus oralis]ORO76745.1 hypothetical protein B7707_07235 [Streptococcus oralis subsp. dentisani]QPT01208.1 hypothetical protein I6G42_06510 [Streptococcus oralis]CAK1608680.1 CRISPR-associated protein (Cas_Cmr3) [Streptococcus oralis subsp. dentisani]